MKTTGMRSIVLYILLAAFVGGFIYLVSTLFLNGKNWVAQPYNGHIYDSDGTADTGNILDRNNLILAETADGKRIYSENTSIRTSLLHTVGDSSGYIATSIQAMHRSKLMGYNFITGLNRTPITALGANNIKLTVDSNLCAAAYNALNGKNGAVIIYNYKNGEVLCKVSTPGYDPMNVPDGLLENSDYKGAFIDNTISSAFVPGSIFKIVTAASAMENISDWKSLTYNCQGSVEIGTGVVSCLGYHGEIGISSAFGNSCNVYFALLAKRLGGASLQATAEEMGFNKNLQFQDFTTAKSIVDLKSATDLEMGWAGVGQFTVTANPTHMMVLMGAIANGGTAISPRIAPKELLGTTGKDLTLMPSSVASELKSLMRNNVSEYYGDWLFEGMNVCAKTGTAEIDGKEPTSWIVGFSDNEETPYAFSIAVEQGGSGIGTAGNIASQLMDMLK